MKKTHWKKVFNSEYLGACDLDDSKDLKAVIKQVVIKGVKSTDGKTQDRNVAIFTDDKIKPMILNVTNSKQVRSFAKSIYIDDWNNIPVQIYIRDDIKAFGEITDGLRIRSVQPQMSKPELTPDNKDDWDKAITYLRGAGTITALKTKRNISAENEEKLKTAVL